jgi:hypothetical protein
MDFDWLVSLSSMLFASVMGGNIDVPEKTKLGPNNTTQIESIIEKVDNSKIATEADLVVALGEKHLEKFIPKKELLAKSNKKLTQDVLVKDLLEMVETKLPKDFSYPPIKETIKFRDISEDNPVFESAQKLKTLEILPENNGFFGKPNNKNPEVKISEMKQMVHKAFDKDGNLNYLQDKDLDGVPNALDACPDLSAKNGCPKIEDTNDFPKDTVLTVSPNVKVVDEKEIEMGDKFSVIIFNPVTEEIYTESEQLTVTK